MLSSPIVLNFPGDLEMSQDEFFEFCQANRELRIERDRYGAISIMPPTGGITGNREGNIFGELYIWTKQDGTGIAFSPSTGFTLSTGANRSPDAAWISLERWNCLLLEQQQKFAPICPNFVVELRSRSDSLQSLQDKMEEYAAEDGFQLGWLIDRQKRRVYIYRPGEEAECLENPDTVSGDPVLPGFVLDMSKIW